MKLVDRFWRWLAWKISFWIVQYLTVGTHCGLCGKWIPYEVGWAAWAWSVCKECEKGGKYTPDMKKTYRVLRCGWDKK